MQLIQCSSFSVVLISQASSEHSICFCVPYEQAKITQKVLEEEFYRELKEQQIGSVSVIGPCSIMAAVGENMNNTPGVASTFFRALGKSNINVRGGRKESKAIEQYTPLMFFLDKPRKIRKVF